VRRAALWLLLGLLSVLGAAGCGLGAGEERDGEVRLRVTETFGQTQVLNQEVGTAVAGDTVLRMLQREAEVRTRDGGGGVQSIDGRSAGRAGGRPVDWSFFVNGIESSAGAGELKLFPGDRVWWDLHDRGTAMRIPAVVGSFPEPFLTGFGGKRIPVRIECTDGAERECDEVAERLENAGVNRTSRSILSQQDEGGVLRVLVGRWPQLRLDPTAQQLERGPAESGVYARLDPAGRRLEVLDPRGRVARTLGAGAGLVAATQRGEGRPVWIVTGTDEIGLAAAAAALEESVLSRHFAVAIENGEATSVPAVEP